MRTTAAIQPGRYELHSLRGRPLRVRTFDIGQLLLYAVGIQILLVLASISFGAELPPSVAAPAVLVSTHQPFSTTVPIIAAAKDGDALAVTPVTLKWNPSADSSDLVRISVEGAPTDPGAQIFQSQASIAALSAAFAWQTPWQGAAWEIGKVPLSDGSAVNAPLAVAMIASAAGVAYPADTAVIADLNPDGSLAPVPQMSARIDAAARAGLKKIVIASVQPFEWVDGKEVDLTLKARSLGLTCVTAKTLAEASSLVLGRPLPSVPTLADDSAPALAPALYQSLESDCNTQLALLEKNRAAWPVTPAQQAALPLWQKSLWSEALIHFQNGVSLLRAKKVYAARGELGETVAEVAALTSLADDSPPVAALTIQAKGLIAEYTAALAKVSDHQEELQNGLVAAEMADWANGIVASLEGAQNLVYQTSGAQSQALPEQRKLAQIELAVAVRKAEAQRDRIASFAALRDTLIAGNTVPVYDRAGLWLPELIPAHLALGESFVLRLQKADASLADSLIYDPALTAQTRLLRDRKAAWDARENVRQIAAADSATAANAASPLQNVGFTPGAAYQPPRASAQEPKPKTAAALSDTEQTLRWVNDYTEMALLYDRYFQFGGSFHPRDMEWTVEDRAVLNAMLANADLAARQGIQAAASTGVDTSMLAMVYERASALRDSPLDSSRMEALRQLWRCNLLGNTAWQLASIPKAEALPSAQQPALTPAVEHPAPAPVEEPVRVAEAADEASMLARLNNIPDPDPNPAPQDPGQPKIPQPLPENRPESPRIDPQPIPISTTASNDSSSEEIRRAEVVTD